LEFWNRLTENENRLTRKGNKHFLLYLLSRPSVNIHRSELFGRMVRLGERTPAHRALKLAVGARCRAPHPHPGGDLVVGSPITLIYAFHYRIVPRLFPGRARDTWLKPLMRSDTSIQLQWDMSDDCPCCATRGHGPTAQRLLPDSRLWWWRLLSVYLRVWNCFWKKKFSQEMSDIIFTIIIYVFYY